MTSAREPHLYIRLAQKYDQMARKSRDRETAILARKTAFRIRKQARDRLRAGRYER